MCSLLYFGGPEAAAALAPVLHEHLMGVSCRVVPGIAAVLSPRPLRIVGPDGRQFTVPLDAALSAKRPGVEFPRRLAFLQDTVKAPDVGHLRPKHHDFDAITLQKGDGAAVDKVPVLRHLAGDGIVKHDLAVDHLIQRLAMHKCQKDRGQAVLPEGARRHIFHNARIQPRPQTISTETTLSRAFPVRSRKSVTAKQAFSPVV